MTYLRMVRTKTKYNVRDAQCIGRECLVLGIYQHRSMLAGGGSRNTGDVTPCCMTRAYRGCPPTEAATQWDPAMAAKRNAEGWRRV